MWGLLGHRANKGASGVSSDTYEGEMEAKWRRNGGEMEAVFDIPRSRPNLLGLGVSYHAVVDDAGLVVAVEDVE